ncbi:class I SAM-dependent methyltransferase [Oceanihabitans sp. 2_MG-2023]|uniref:class I SAM-dependent methyltransferase n=1 Tax=Oceanihabitans sp. 2_MG-2023 TaxID=3062661 RepID=UPI0026E4928F|nr:class I SAM-dependent methyltransferase [Oceanihabitans sp. 2_MG-2023]MDO6597474.1 class I SAM-dependent methyltransferase [Oceanihabitans sp. 2_MG-2023]
MFSFSTEITSSQITSDQPLFQRTLKAYHLIAEKIHGNVLEIGCGEGYGLDLILKKAKNITVIDKSKYVLDKIKYRHPKTTILHQNIPPLSNLKDNSFDVVISFQVIEHIKDVNLFINEIHRVLKPNGKAYITTPNAKKSIARNPWHVKEYKYSELNDLIKKKFIKYTIEGIQGNKKTDQYYFKNEQSVKRIMRFDIFNIQYKLPKTLLKIPYEIANRMNRITLLNKNRELVNNIKLEDYSLQKYSKDTLDFFCILTK